MKKIFSNLTATLFFLSLAACSGSGDGSNDDDAAGSVRYLSGAAEDGPIAGARIKLIDPRSSAEDKVVRACGASGVGRCEALTAEDGTFSLQLRSDLLLDPLEILSVGGYDKDVGKINLTLRAPLALFAGREDRVMISPVTSVLAGAIERGSSLPVAAEKVRQWLALPPDFDLTDSPAVDPDFQQKTLMVTSIALAMAGQNPFALLGEKVAASPSQDLHLDKNSLAALGIGEERSLELLRLFEILGRGADEWKKGVLSLDLKNFADKQSAAAAGFNAEDSQYLLNLDRVTEQVLRALGPYPLPLLGQRFPSKRIARYVLYKYLLADKLLFSETETLLEKLKDPETGLPLHADPYILELAQLEEVNSAAFALFAEELPGNDSQKRLEYFYRSDLSPFYLAEKINHEIFDDRYSDELMVNIAIGKANAGLLAEAEAIIATQIYQTDLLSEAYLQYAEVLIKFNRFTEANASLQKAEGLSKQVVEKKGYTGINATDAKRLQSIGSGYRHAGDSARALAIYDYIVEIARYLDSPILYGSVIVGTWQVADQYLAEGRNDLATPLVDFMYVLALSTPPNVTGSNFSSKAKIFYLLETAKRYADLGQLEQVNAIYQTVQAIRANDGYQNLTAGETWTYMVDFVELLYRTAAAAEAYALANQMPTAYALKAYKLVATYEAVQNGLPAALGIIDTQIPLATDQIEALTYFATNKNREYIALAFIERNLLDAAKQSLDHALAKVSALAPGTDADRFTQLIQLGYVKVAELYALAGDPLMAELLLREKALPALLTISGLKYRIDALTGIALGYQALGNNLQSDELLLQAQEEIDAGVATAVPPDNPALRGKLYEDLAALYESVLKAYALSGSRDQTLNTVNAYLVVIRQIFDAAATYTGNEHDTYAGKKVDKLLKAAEYRRLAGDVAGATLLLAEAETAARQLWVEASRSGKLINTVGGYAAAGQFDAALNLARAFATSDERQQALQKITLTYVGRDDFPTSELAHIDTDHDGRPDFFNPLATAAEIIDSGLLLDEDCDGDGILDSEDSRPFFRDTPLL